jgi:hypothetical protein
METHTKFIEAMMLSILFGSRTDESRNYLRHQRVPTCTCICNADKGISIYYVIKALATFDRPFPLSSNFVRHQTPPLPLDDVITAAFLNLTNIQHLLTKAFKPDFRHCYI